MTVFAPGSTTLVVVLVVCCVLVIVTQTTGAVAVATCPADAVIVPPSTCEVEICDVVHVQLQLMVLYSPAVEIHVEDGFHEYSTGHPFPS